MAANLDTLPLIPIQEIIKCLSLKDEQRLRLVNSNLYQRITELDKRFRQPGLGKLTDIDELCEITDVFKRLDGIGAGTNVDPPKEEEVTADDLQEWTETDLALQTLVENHPDLVKVLLKSAWVSDVGLSTLLTLENLESLTLQNSWITGLYLNPELVPTSNLTSLRLVKCPYLNTEGLMKIMKRCEPRLKYLWLHGLDLQDLHLLSEVSPSLSSVLEELTLSSCDLARPLDLAILVKAFGRTIKVLRWSMNTLKEKSNDIYKLLHTTMTDMDASAACLTEVDFKDFIDCLILAILLRHCGASLTKLKVSLQDLPGNNIAVDPGPPGAILHATMTEVARLTSLQHLEIHCESQKISVDDANVMPILLAGEQLRVLELTNTSLCLDGLRPDKLYLARIERLNLSSSRINDAGATNLLNNCGPGLKYLNLSGSLISKSFAGVTKKFPACRELVLKDCLELRSSGLADLVKIFRGSLKVLDIENCRRMDKLKGFFYEYVAGEKVGELEPMHSVKKVNWTCVPLRDWLNKLIKTFPQVRSLHLSGRPTSLDLSSLSPATISYIEELVLEKSDLSDVDLCKILEAFHQTLRKLDISDAKITGETLRTISRPLPHISHVNLSRCLKVTRSGWTELVRLLERVENLVMISCGSFVSRDAALNQRQYFPRLQQLTLFNK